MNFFLSPTNNMKIPLSINKSVFLPNLTSELIIKAISVNKKKINAQKILDMGCGTGVIGICIKKKIFKDSKIYFSDISLRATELTRLNCIKNKIKFSIKQSDLFLKWKGENFDLVVNDVSGISSFFFKNKIWYNKSIPSDTGMDGTKQILKFIKELKKSKTKIAIMPLISLCNFEKVLNTLKKLNFKYTVLLEKDWPLPKAIVIKHKKKLLELKEKKKIFFEEKFNYFVANTKVLYLKNRT